MATIKDIKEALAVDPAEWGADLEDNLEYLRFLGPRVPQEVHNQLDALQKRIEA